MDIWANLQPLKCHYALADGQILPQTSEHLVKNFYAESALHSFCVSSDLSLFTIFKYFFMLDIDVLFADNKKASFNCATFQTFNVTTEMR